MADEHVARFTLSGRQFRFDYDVKLMTGDQTELVRRHIGMSALEFLRAAININSENFDDRVVLMTAFLAEYRGNEYIEWESFIRTVSPFDLDVVQEPGADADSGADDSIPAAETIAEKKPAPATRRAPRKAPAKK